MALQPRGGSRGEVEGSGLGDVEVECWEDGQGGAQDKGRGADRKIRMTEGSRKEVAQDPGKVSARIWEVGKGRGGAFNSARGAPPPPRSLNQCSLFSFLVRICWKPQQALWSCLRQDEPRVGSDSLA